MRIKWSRAQLCLTHPSGSALHSVCRLRGWSLLCSGTAVPASKEAARWMKQRTPADLISHFDVACDGTSVFKVVTPARRIPWFLGNAKCMGPHNGSWLCDNTSSHAHWQTPRGIIGHCHEQPIFPPGLVSFKIALDFLDSWHIFIHIYVSVHWDFLTAVLRTRSFGMCLTEEMGKFLCPLRWCASECRVHLRCRCSLTGTVNPRADDEAAGSPRAQLHGPHPCFLGPAIGYSALSSHSSRVTCLSPISSRLRSIVSQGILPDPSLFPCFQSTLPSLPRFILKH